MEQIDIVIVHKKDIQELQKIGSATFFETYSVANTKKNMEKYLKACFSIEKLTSELNDKNSKFYFALSNQKVVGYLKLNFGSSQTEIKNTECIEIERFYVLKEFHGRKIGKMLFEKAIEIANDYNAKFIWLGVWEENTTAINFYKKNGFIVFDKHLFKLGDDEQTDILMKFQLNSH